jgi:hypothetical protein
LPFGLASPFFLGYNLFLTIGGSSMSMSKISRFIVWICSKFNRDEVEKIATELTMLLKDPNAVIKPMKDKFKEEHPNYRNFDADEDVPLSEPSPSKKKRRKTTR